MNGHDVPEGEPADVSPVSYVCSGHRGPRGVPVVLPAGHVHGVASVDVVVLFSLDADTHERFRAAFGPALTISER